MKITIDKESKYLYHFTSKERLIENILPSLKLKLNNLKNTNDPKEKKASTAHVIADLHFAGDYLEISGRLRTLLDVKYTICCFSSDYYYIEKPFKGYNLPRMWATYGKNHQGICLVINKEKFIEENNIDSQLLFLKPVDYSSGSENLIHNINDPQSTDFNDIATRIIKQNQNSLFFSKHHDWITENEVRLLSISGDSYCSIGESLEMIILGEDFNLKYRPSIIEQFKDKGKLGSITIQKISFNHLSGELEIKKASKANNSE